MLKLRRFGIDTYGEHVAVLSRACPAYRAEEFLALKKIEVVADGHQMLATVVVSDDPDLVAPDELGLSIRAFERFARPEGTLVSISQATPPGSLDSVRAKIAGHTLGPDELRAIVSDIAERRYSDMEIAAFLISSATFLTTEEILHLTRAMAEAGNQLAWDAPMVVDKHCIGGIPGNRTSMIVVPIVAAHGMPIPKTSSRAITSPAGTADTMEVLARVDLSTDEITGVVEQERGCLVWGGSVNLSPADDILISVERPLGIDTREQMVASILSKKLAAGSTHLLIDVPVGPTAKVRSPLGAVRLRKLFEYIGDQIGLVLETEITDAQQPVGRGIGPVLEARDVMAVLRNDPDAPADLRDKAVRLAGRILDFDPGMRGGAGIERAGELLASGAALAKMEAIIAAQGRQTADHALGTLTHEVPSPTDGVVAAIDCHRMARIARLSGAPLDKGAGILVHKKLGDRVERGEPLYRIHACVDADFRFATAYAAADDGYAVESDRPGAGG